MNVFEAVKENVTTRHAAQAYGIQVNRKGMGLCLFHNDKKPSMKTEKRFHCFGCQADGDLIDFTARLYGLSPRGVAEKLAEDFGIRYDNRGRDSPKPTRRKLAEELRFRKTVQNHIQVFSDYLYLLEKREKEYAQQQLGDEWHPLFIEALQERSRKENLLDILLSGTAGKKEAAITGYGKEVRKLERRISEIVTCHPAGREERRWSHMTCQEFWGNKKIMK